MYWRMIISTAQLNNSGDAIEHCEAVTTLPSGLQLTHSDSACIISGAGRQPVDTDQLRYLS